MYEIVTARTLAPSVIQLGVRAPRIAERQRPGQFVIVRVTRNGERIPLTIADADAGDGSISLVVQAVGKTTALLAGLGPGDHLQDVAGPLGLPTEIERFGTVVVVGGGVGVAIAFPVARALAAAGNRVIAVIGARSADLVILEDEMRAAVGEVRVATDDGSYGYHGLVTDVLADLLGSADRVFAVGPIPMMAAVAEQTRPLSIPTVASLNPIMVDGTGMCGGCRVRVGGEAKFACVDGPEFDAHLVDFGLLARRNRAYRDFEARRLADLGSVGARS